MRWNGQLEAFLESFLDYSNADAATLPADLLSVPQDSWGTVWVRLEVALHEEEGKWLPPVNTFQPGKPIEAWHITEEVLRNTDIVDLKQQILHEENRRRMPTR